jgi:hypothetical protein
MMSQLAEAPSYTSPPECMRELHFGSGEPLGEILPLIDADPDAHRDDPWPAGEIARRLVELSPAPPAEPNVDGDHERLGAVAISTVCPGPRRPRYRQTSTSCARPPWRGSAVK